MLQTCYVRTAPGRFSRWRACLVPARKPATDLVDLRLPSDHVATNRRRLDTELVRRKLSSSTTAAQSLISGGRVRVSGAVATKPSRLVSEAEAVNVSDGGPQYASRGGHKLAAALDHFGIDPAGKVVVDVGASTGGFTDCLLQRGAKKVFAIDVGRGQLLTRLANDQRVVMMDKCNVRHLTSAEALHGVSSAESVALLTADLSFISLRTVLPNLVALAKPVGNTVASDLVLLVKPQFELPRRAVDPTGGVVSDPALWRQAIDEVTQAAIDSGLVPCGEFESPVAGAAGNIEFFLRCRLERCQLESGVT